MKPDRAAAILTGVLFILATTMGILAVGLFGPVIASPDYLVGMSESAGIVHISMLLDLIMAVAVVAVAVVIFPVLRRENETLAVGYLAARTVEGVMLAMAGVTWLVLVNISHDFVQAGQPSQSYFQTMGNLWMGAGTTIFSIGAEILFGITALILNYVLFRAKLVPRFISVWGFVGGALILILGAMKILGLDVSLIEIAFTVPIVLTEMVLAVWLIAKGFSSSQG
jgi:hypothetical protein